MKRRLKEDNTITSAKKLEDAIKNMWIKEMDAKYFQNPLTPCPREFSGLLSITER